MSLLFWVSSSRLDRAVGDLEANKLEKVFFFFFHQDDVCSVLYLFVERDLPRERTAYVTAFWSRPINIKSRMGPGVPADPATSAQALTT